MNPQKKRRRKGDGGITQRSDGTFQGTVPYRDEFDCRKVKYFYGPTKGGVLTAMRDFKAGGCQVEARDERTVGDLVDHLLGAEGTLYRAGGQLARTLDDYRAKVHLHVLPFLGGTRLRKLDAAMVDRVLLELVDGGKRRTALHVRYILCKLLAEGVRLGWLASNPAEAAMPVSVPKRKRPIYGLDQLRAVADAAEDPKVRAWVLLAGVAGLRESEIAGLMWSSLRGRDLTVERQRHREGTKTASGTRVIRLPEPVWDALRDLPRESLWVFPAGRRAAKGRQKPVAVHPSTIYHKVQRAIEAAKMPKVTVHDLRHSANNILKQLGVDAATRRDILGHASTSTTENVYSQTVDAEIISAAGLVDRAWAERKERAEHG